MLFYVLVHIMWHMTKSNFLITQEGEGHTQRYDKEEELTRTPLLM